MAALRIRWLRLESGERLPVLMAVSGMPLFRPMVWLSTMRRTSRAANTLHADLQAVKRLYDWAAAAEINIEQRMLDGRLLSTAEMASLVAVIRQAADDARHPSNRQPRIAHLPAMVCSQTAGNRLHVIAEYLGWLAREGCTRLSSEETAVRLSLRDEMATQLKAMTPKNRGRSGIGEREGPPQDVVRRLLDVIEIDHSENPWGDVGLRMRNRLLIHLLYALGLRRGELLALRIEQIDFRTGALTVVRAADDQDDPRLYQPLAKTRDRVLPLKESLIQALEEYVLHVRPKIPGARRHSYLLVSHQTGQPLSLASANKVFTALRQRVEGLPENLSPHLLRHAWNDAFSALMDERKVAPEREQQMRSMMMGWSPTSGMAATYTKRHVRNAAREASLAHQESLTKGRDK